MKDAKSEKRKKLIIVILSFLVFLVELYLYVFVRNDNILDLFVTIAAGIVLIVVLTIYIMHAKDDSSKKP